jgi:hypothetical protein
MDLTLKSLQYHGNDHNTILMKVGISFAWDDKMINDSILISYNKSKHDAQINVRAQHRGISIVAARIIEVIADIDFKPCANPPQIILEKLAENLHMDYSEEEAEKFFNSI